VVIAIIGSVCLFFGHSACL